MGAGTTPSTGGYCPEHPVPAAAEEAERQRLVREVVGVLRATSAPVVALAEATLDPDGVLRRAVGGLRARTIRQRLRAITKFTKWLRAAGICGWPVGDEGVRAALHYLDEMVGGSCSQSAPVSFLTGARFFEKVGAVVGGFSGTHLVEATVKEHVTKNVQNGERGGQDAKQSEKRSMK